jgi:DNA-binding GntR family transcriptional regulator
MQSHPRSAIHDGVKTESGASRTEDLTTALREAIVTGDLEPGTRLVEAKLAERYGVSRIPVREVLRQLATEGYVQAVPNRGAVVASPGELEAVALLDVREALEVLIAEGAARNRSAQDVTALRAIVAKAGELLNGEDGSSALVVLNSRFHDAMATAAGNPVAAQILAQLRSRIQWVYAARIDIRADASWAEHAAIADAIAAGHCRKAAALTREHLARARDALTNDSTS